MEKIAQNNLEKEIRSIVAEILEIKEGNIRPDANFAEELDMDSMMALEILASVEKKYKIKIPEEYLTKVTSLRNMVAIARKIMEKK